MPKKPKRPVGTNQVTAALPPGVLLATTGLKREPLKPPKPKYRPKGNNGGGIAPFEPTPVDRQTVETLAGYQLDAHKIARLIINPRTGKPISTKLLRLYFSEELLNGDAKAESLVAQSLFKAAQKGNVGAAIWLEKTRWGRVAPEDVRLSGGDGGPIKTQQLELTQGERAEKVANLINLATARAARRKKAG